MDLEIVERRRAEEFEPFVNSEIGSSYYVISEDLSSENSANATLERVISCWY